MTRNWDLEAQQIVIVLVSIFLIITTSGFFAAGIVRASISTKDSNDNSSTESTSSEILEDNTFLLLLSTIIPNCLNNLLELAKLSINWPKGWRGGLLAIVPVLLIASTTLAFAAPIIYANASQDDPGRSLNPTILSFSANMISILANVVSVLMVEDVRRRRYCL
jgi:Na+/proline symporter